jgi:hypothetical protein
MNKDKRRTGPRATAKDCLYELEVFLIDGPMTKTFVSQNPVVSRAIQIRGAQSLEILHYAIFGAFGREDHHMYEFQVGGKGPMDPKARRYVLSGEFDNPMPGTPKPAGDVTCTAIDSLGLKTGDAFGYWFDFGDNWWHQINVVALEEKVPRGSFPRVTKRTGENPPQYVDWEEEDEH